MPVLPLQETWRLWMLLNDSAWGISNLQVKLCLMQTYQVWAVAQCEGPRGSLLLSTRVTNDLLCYVMINSRSSQQLNLPSIIQVDYVNCFMRFTHDSDCQ
jgi:hypothetical protein